MGFNDVAEDLIMVARHGFDEATRSEKGNGWACFTTMLGCKGCNGLARFLGT